MWKMFEPRSLKLSPQAQIVKVFVKVLNLEAKPDRLSKISGTEKDANVVIFKK
jgi:hypothetical protein